MAEPAQDASRWWMLPVGALGAGLLLSIPFWTGDLDVRVAAWVQAWNEAQGGAQQDRWWWRLPYRVPAVLVVLLSLGVVVAVIRGLRTPASGLLRPGIYVALVLILGCGVLTNAVLKDHWGRPRPRDTEQFGGTRAYIPPWVIGERHGGKSFPSGHVAVPAACSCLWLLWRRRRPLLARWCLGLSLGLAAWVGAARMLAQGHWLSDVLWATVLMVVTAALLHRLVLGRQAVTPAG